MGVEINPATERDTLDVKEFLSGQGASDFSVATAARVISRIEDGTVLVARNNKDEVVGVGSVLPPPLLRASGLAHALLDKPESGMVAHISHFVVHARLDAGAKKEVATRLLSAMVDEASSAKHIVANTREGTNDGVFAKIFEGHGFKSQTDGVKTTQPATILVRENANPSPLPPKSVLSHLPSGRYGNG